MLVKEQNGTQAGDQAGSEELEVELSEKYSVWDSQLRTTSCEFRGDLQEEHSGETEA